MFIPQNDVLLLMERAPLFSRSLPYTNAHTYNTDTHTEKHTCTQKLVVSSALCIY